jgi:hypothetical protein
MYGSCVHLTEVYSLDCREKPPEKALRCLQRSLAGHYGLPSNGLLGNSEGMKRAGAVRDPGSIDILWNQLANAAEMCQLSFGTNLTLLGLTGTAASIGGHCAGRHYSHYERR